MRKATVFPDCPHLLEGKMCCTWASARLGRVVHVSPIMCNVTCPKIGPYCGQEPADPDGFTYQCWLRVFGYMSSVQFIRRQLIKYSRSIDISIPEEWGEIQDSLMFLEEDPNFYRVLLTGSIVASVPRPVKDLDVVLWYRDIRPVVEREMEIKESLPKTIGGVKVDYWLLSNPPGPENLVPDPFFITVDPVDRKIYTSRWFTPHIVSIPEGYILIETELGRFGELMDKALAKAAEPCEGCH